MSLFIINTRILLYIQTYNIESVNSNFRKYIPFLHENPMFFKIFRFI